MEDRLTEVPGGLGDIETAEFEAAAQRAVAWAAAYLDSLRERRVTPEVTPGYLLRALPPTAAEDPDSLQHILDDFESLVVPGITHWNHPRFFGYFGITGSAPGIVAELLIASLNVNAMQWMTSPAASELEQVTTEWLRQAMGLPEGFRGVINDTASTSTLYALAAAREAVPGLDVRRSGLAGNRLRLYTSVEAHSSVEKAAIVLGVGEEGVAKLPVDAGLRMDAAELASAIARDRAAGWRPFAVVGTVGTTSTTAVDPIPQIGAVCRREGVWLHVDAAYGGAAAVLPSHRHVLDGCDLADSVVINPHKWLFTPIDCSLLYCRREDVLMRTFSLVPDYLQEPDAGQARNLSDYGLALGRRFRSLKLWFVLRAFGLAGVRERIAAHIAMARQLVAWIESEPDFEVLAPAPFSTVVFRHRSDDARNQRVVEAVNRSGHAFISHTRVRGAYAMRLAIGNVRTTPDDVRSTWDLIKEISREDV